MEIFSDINNKELILSAKAKGLYLNIESFDNLGGYIKCSESIVYCDKENGKVIKLKDIYQFAHREKVVKDAPFYHIVHNIYFPETNYKFLGITEVDGVMRFVLEQPYISEIRGASEREWTELLNERGFENISNDKHAVFENGLESRVDDINEHNVIVGDKNKVYVVDAVFRVKHGALNLIKKHVCEPLVMREINTLLPLYPELQGVLDYYNENLFHEEKITVEETSRLHICSAGKVFRRKSDGFIMGNGLDIGVNDSIENYEEIDLGSPDSIDNYKDEPYTEESYKAFYESI